MRDAIGSTWFFQLIIIFILIFVAFLTLALNYSRAFRVKNEITNIIEKYEGLNDNSVKIINDFLRNNGYTEMGVCSEDNTADQWKGVDSLQIGSYAYTADNGKEYYYCVKKNVSEGNNKTYYDIMLFFKFNLPVVGEMLTFKITGSTVDIVFPTDTTNGGSTRPPSTQTYTITFNSDGGDQTFTDQTITSGNKASNPGSPTKSGCIFEGWYSGNAAFSFNSSVTRNYDLIAKWTC